MNAMEGDNAYSQSRGGDTHDFDGEDAPRSSDHKSKKKKKSSKRNVDSPDEERHSSARKSDEDGEIRKRKKKTKQREGHFSGNTSSGSPDEEHHSSRKSKSSGDLERKSSRKSRDSDRERKSSRRSKDRDDDEDYERKPAADRDHRSSRKSGRSDEDSDDKKSKSRSHKTDDASRASRASAASGTLGADIESQMASKRRPTGPRPTRPGAVSGSTSAASSATASNLSQFEQDVQAKNRARRSAKSASTPGVVREPGDSRPAVSNPNAIAALSRLEQDAMAKSRASRPSGAVAATGGYQHGKASGRTSQSSASRSSAAAAAVGAGYKTTGLDAPQPASAAQRARLLAVEEDLAAKTRAGSSRPSAPAVAGAAAVGGALGAAIATSGPSPEPYGAADAVTQLENDVLGKAHRSTMADDPVEPIVRNAQPEPEDNDYMDSFAVHEPMPRVAPAISAAGDVQNGHVNAEGGQSADADGATDEHAEVYPGVDFASQEFANEGAVEAFVADNVVDATGVAVVMSEEEENQIERRKYKKYLIIAFICMVLIAVAIVVPVVLVVGNVEPAAPSMAPSSAPSMAPSSAPTSGRLDAIVESLTTVSGAEALQDKTSPQFQAAHWVSDEDPLALPIGDAQLLQRYLLAVFYFAMNGDEWLHCGRLDPICGGDPDEDSWLSESNECIWLGNRCVDGQNVDRIFFGECMSTRLHAFACCCLSKLKQPLRMHLIIARTFGNDLNGTFPSEITLLPRLESLILQNNFIRGTIPEFLSEISLLNTLILSGNPLEGTIPEIFLQNSPLLGTLHLSRSNLNGTIPTELAMLPLTDLRLDENALSGPIPAQLGSISTLRK